MTPSRQRTIRLARRRELVSPLLFGHCRPKPGRHGHVGDQRQHDLGRIVGQYPAVGGWRNRETALLVLCGQVGVKNVVQDLGSTVRAGLVHHYVLAGVSDQRRARRLDA
jgi:hypothetical protein